jgi:hypothetical protein
MHNMRNTVITLALLLSKAAPSLAQQTYLSKEYIRAGARTIAVENYVDLNLSTATDATQSNPWTVVATADFNGDGVPDLVWQDPSTGTVQIWFMTGVNGTTILSAANITGSATSWKVVAAADFNGSGTPDLVLQNPSGGAAEVWYLTVSGSPAQYTITYTTGAFNGGAGNTWHVLAAADFNQDGHPDLVWQNPTGGAIQIWYLTGSLGTTLLSAANVVGSSSLNVVATADFNADGIPDLVVQNPTTGLLQVWFMAAGTNGTILSSFGVTTSNPWRVKAAAINGSPYFAWVGSNGFVQYWFMADL